MAMISNHSRYYIERAVRTQKKEYVNSLIKATYYAEKNQTSERPLRKILMERLENFLALYRDDVKGYTNGIGGYSVDQFDKDYTVGHEMGIWKNSALELSDFAKKVARDEITITQYFDRVFLNFFQPVDMKGVHPLYRILKYMINNNKNEISIDDIRVALNVPIEDQDIIGLIHYLGATSYFSEIKNGLEYVYDISVNDLIKKCNIRYEADGYEKYALEELNNSENYCNYLASDNEEAVSDADIEVEIDLDEKQEEVKKKFKNWLFTSRGYKPNYVKSCIYYVGKYIKKCGYTDYDLFLVDDINLINDLIYKFNNDDHFKNWDKLNRNTPRASLSAYRDFLIEENKKNKNNYVMSIKDFSTVHKPFFDKYGYMYWDEGLEKKYKIGDIIYLYFSSDNGNQYSKIMMKVIVDEINVPRNILDDSKYYELLGYSNDSESKYFIKVRILGNSDGSEELSYNNLKEKFKFFSPENGTRLLSIDEATYIEKHFITEDVDVVFLNDKRIVGASNIIYYGVPGCGKSWVADKKAKELTNENEDLIIRTTFYPDYNNSDFVGQIIPKIDENDKNSVLYDIQGGPFTDALVKAIDNPSKYVCLIIEEINRGNAAAIFGDLFQLLDRDDKGNSEYSIKNYTITKYLEKHCKNRSYDISEIKIPSNLVLIGTMNTSDQNVFTLDTAFKRRWNTEYIRNDVNNSKFAKELVPMINIEWKDFVKKINDLITSNDADFGINGEDKQIGAYFISNQEWKKINTSEKKEAAKLFAEKVLSYIWEDVAKINKKSMFKKDYTKFDDLLDDFIDHGDVLEISNSGE